VKITLNKEHLDNLTLEETIKIVPPFARATYAKNAGAEHYRLLEFFSNLYYNETLIDVGTNIGCSAIALASNKSNFVLSYDVHSRSQKYIELNAYVWATHFNVVIGELGKGRKFNGINDVEDIENVDFIVTHNFIKYTENFLKSPFIFLDIDHRGNTELEFIKKLIECKYQGLLLLDDIHCFEDMQKLWDALDEPSFQKIDITKYGHFGGTGLLNFNKNIEIVLE